MSNQFRGGKICFIWHGGEPLVQGLDFYKKAIAFQQKHTEIEFKNLIQTNGSLVSYEHLAFFKENKFRLGFSIDGTESLHNESRPYASGEPSFANCFNSLLKSKEFGTGQGAITVVTKRNINHLNEIISFFNSHDLSLKFSPLVTTGRAESDRSSLFVPPPELGIKMAEAFDYWYSNNDITINVEPFARIVGNIITKIPEGCNYMGSCQDRYLSINAVGDVFPCGRYDGFDAFKMGNITIDETSTILNSPVRKTLRQRVTGNIKGCSDCKYVGICNGGCMNNVHNVHVNMFNRDIYCKAYKILFEHIDNAIQKDLSMITKKQGKNTHAQQKR